ncbi:MAG: RNA-binding domain-containing protein, partial [Candidatus Hermodarchaeota archaeon]
KCCAIWVIFICIFLLITMAITSSWTQIPIIIMVIMILVIIAPIMVNALLKFIKPRNLRNNAVIDEEFIKKLLKRRECENLDFKLEFYKLFHEDPNKKNKARTDLIKDIISLSNIIKPELYFGPSYIIIGIDDDNDYYNGIYTSINLTRELSQIFFQIIKDYIDPTPNIELKHFFIAGDKKNIEISMRVKEGYNKVLLIIIKHQIGQIYEVKNNIYNIKKGQAFTRIGSHNKVLIQNERNLIQNFKKKRKIFSSI